MVGVALEFGARRRCSDMMSPAKNGENKAGEREDDDDAGVATATQRYDGRGEVTVMQMLVLALDRAAATFARDDILPTWGIQALQHLRVGPRVPESRQ